MRALLDSTPRNPAVVAARTWRDRWREWRDERLMDADFRRRASASWWGRWVVRRRAGRLFDLMAGFVYSQTLLACVRLRVFDHLAGGPLMPAQLAALVGLSEDRLLRLVDAGCALQLLERRDSGAVGLGVLGAPMVTDPGIAAMVEHHGLLYDDLRDPVALLRSDPAEGRMARYWRYVHTHAPGELADEEVAAYSALMTASQPMVAEEVLQAYGLEGHRCLLDVGGGEGRFLMEVARRAPHLKLMLFDLPAVAERARDGLSVAGLAGRCEVHGGDFTRDALPEGADVISLIRVAFDHPDERVLAVLQSVRRALPPGGTVLLAEPMSQTPGAEAMGDAYFNLYLMAMGRGRARSAGQLGALLQQAGFTGVRLAPTRLPLQTRVLVAQTRKA